MPVDLLISPPSSGKTEECVQRVRGLLLERPFAPIRVVLPDRLQCAAYQGRYADWRLPEMAVLRELLQGPWQQVSSSQPALS